MPKEFSSTIYESTAQAYNTGRKADPVITKTLKDHFSSNQQCSYLDVGCGTGNYTQALFNEGLNIQGIDLSPSMLSEAKKNYPQISWKEADMRKVPFANNCFDGAVTINTLHYVRHSLFDFFCEMKRILKKGGRLVMFLVTLEQCLQFWVGHYFPFFWKVGKKILISKQEILNTLEKSGFKNLQSIPYSITKQSEDLYIYACKYRPHLLLDPSIREGMTPFQRPEYKNEVEAGCKRLQTDIGTGNINKVINQHESSLGEGLFISADS